MAYSVTAFAQPATTIGTLAELTGAYARLGDDCRKAYEVAKRNAPPTVKVLFGDNQSDPKIGITEFRRMVTAEHASIVVTTRSPVGLALNPLSLQQKIPLIGVIGHPRFIKENPYAIRVFPSAADEAQGLANAVTQNNENSIATISLEDEYFLGLKNAFEAIVGNDKIVLSKTIAPTEQDFATLLAQIKEKSPSALFLNVSPAQHGPFIKRLREMEIKAHIYANFLIGSADVRKGLSALADGVIFVEPEYEKPAFLKALAEQSGSSDSSPIGYGCYVGLTYALQLADHAASRRIAPIDAISSLAQITTLDGPITIQDREAKFKVVTKLIRDGRVERVVRALVSPRD